MAIDFRAHLKSFLNWRQPGGALSVGGHALIVIVSVYAFNSAKPFAPATESLPVDVVSEKDFNEMMKGDKTSKTIAKVPARRVDRVAETKEDKDPGLDKRDVPAIPTRQEAEAEVKPEPKLAAIIPPTRPPELRVAPPLPTPPVRPEPEEEEVKDAEIIKQKAPPPKKEEPKKAEPQPDQLQKLLEEKQREAEKALETQRKLAEDKRKLDEKLKAEAEKRAEDKKKADELKKAEAERKAKEAKAKKDREAAEAEKLNDAIRQKLLASKETPSSTGSTGAVVASRSTAGTTDATGQKLSPSDRAQLIGILTEKMSRCISYSGSAPKIGPQLTFTLGRDGSVVSAVQVANRSGEASFVPFAEASMRAIRNCQPYNVPARFMDSYEDWKNIRLNLDTSEMQ